MCAFYNSKNKVYIDKWLLHMQKRKRTQKQTTIYIKCEIVNSQFM